MTCPNCSKEANRFDDKCLYCGYPFVGDEKQQKRFLAASDPLVASSLIVERKLLAAKIILIAIGLLSIVGGLLASADTKILLSGLIYGAVMITLGLIVRRSPMLITTSMLIVFVAMFLLQSLVSPEMASRSIYAKGTVIVLLTAAMIAVSDLRRYKSKS